MTDVCIYPIVAATGVARACAPIAPAEKPRCDKGLQQDVTLQPMRTGATDSGGERRRASHSGTYSQAPAWNGPRLQAAFVAQVLGQVLAPQTGDPRLARAAYQHNDVGGRQSRLLDSEV
jgi:hypothetical protein